MHKWIQVFVLFLSLFFAHSTLAADQSNESPVGYWKTIDDVSGKAKAVLQISETDDHKLQGKIVKTFLDKNAAPYDRCTACKGSKHNQPIIGLVILENLKSKTDHPTDWTGGKILDPKSGKIYNCNIKVIEGGKKLTVRGYIGLPLFGRTQTWIRVSNPS